MSVSSSIFNSEMLKVWVRFLTESWKAVTAILLAGCLTIFLGTRLVSDVFVPERWMSPQAQILAIGTSHAADGLNNLAMPWPLGVFTLAGADHQLMSVAYQEHRDRWPHARLALIELDEYNLKMDRVWHLSTRADLSHLVGRLDLSVWDLPHRDDRGLRWTWKAKNLLYGHGLASTYPARRMSFNNLGHLWSRRGWKVVPKVPMPAPPLPKTKDKPTAQAVQQGIARVEELSHPPRWNLEGLETLVRALDQQGIEVIALSYPSHCRYNESRPQAWDELIDTALQRMRKAAPGQDIPYWNFRDAPFADQAFANATHLNRAGAWRLSVELAARIASKTRFGQEHPAPPAWAKSPASQ